MGQDIYLSSPSFSFSSYPSSSPLYHDRQGVLTTQILLTIYQHYYYYYYQREIIT